MIGGVDPQGSVLRPQPWLGNRNSYRVAAAYDHLTYGFHPRRNEGCLPARGHRLAHGEDDTKNGGRKMYRN